MTNLILPFPNPEFFKYKDDLTSVNLSTAERQIQDNLKFVTNILGAILNKSLPWVPGDQYKAGVNIVVYSGQNWIAALDNYGSEPSLSNPDWTLIPSSDLGTVSGGDGSSGGASVNISSTYHISTGGEITLPYASLPTDTVLIYSQGVLLREGYDWSRTETTLTFATPLTKGERIDIVGFIADADVPVVIPAPILSGSSTGNELANLNIVIENYDPTSTSYYVSVTGGSYSRTANNIVWSLPEVVIDTFYKLSIIAITVEGSSAVTEKTVKILAVEVANNDSVAQVTDYQSVAESVDGFDYI